MPVLAALGFLSSVNPALQLLPRQCLRCATKPRSIPLFVIGLGWPNGESKQAMPSPPRKTGNAVPLKKSCWTSTGLLKLLFVATRQIGFGSTNVGNQNNPRPDPQKHQFAKLPPC